MVPDLVLRSTFIVGFPGETEADFEQLMQWLEAAQLDRVGCFTYSPVEGATANVLPGAVDPEVAEQRRERFMHLQENISANRLIAKVGAEMRVLVDEPAEAGLEREAPVLVHGRIHADVDDVADRGDVGLVSSGHGDIVP